MFRPVRVAVLLVLVVLGSLVAALPGRAQQATQSRFAFADTTLLRDTLDLHFTHLFETADSLRVLPDSLRALMIRYRFTIPKILFLADSLGMPVDSVGPVFARAQFDVFAARLPAGRSRTTFTYTSTYDIQQTTSDWGNGLTYQYLRGPLFLTNQTNIDLSRLTNGDPNFETRVSTSTLDWKLSPRLSTGFVVASNNTDNPSNNVFQKINDYKFKAQTRSSLGHNLSSELVAQSGFHDENSSNTVKRAWSGDVNGRLRTQSGTWFSHDFSADLSGNAGRTRTPQAPLELGSLDLAGTANGTLSLFAQSPASLIAHYGYRNSRVDQPTPADTIRHVRTSGATADGTLRVQRDNNNYVDMTGSLSSNNTVNSDLFDRSGKAHARATLGLSSIDVTYLVDHSRNDIPLQGKFGGYNQNSGTHSLDGLLTRPLGTNFQFQIRGSISLTQQRFDFTSPTAVIAVTPADALTQSWDATLSYASTNVKNTLSFRDALNRNIQLPSRATGSNTDTRIYHAQWDWSYRLLPGLTATQSDFVDATYRFFPFQPAQNDLTLNYSETTNLSAVVTPRLQVSLTHTGVQTPRGNYLKQPDGQESLQLSNEILSASLTANIVYNAFKGVSFQVSPTYMSTGQNTTQNGSTQPTRRGRTLTMLPRVNVDLDLGQRGKLSGFLERTLRSDRQQNGVNGVLQPSPRVQQDYWHGSLGLTWTL